MATRLSPSESGSPRSPKSNSSRGPTGASPPAFGTVVEGGYTTTYHPEIEAEDYSESAYSDDSEVESYTTSLSESVLDFHYENGRRYYSRSMGENKYFLPNDEKESDRLDLRHHIMTIIQKGALHAAPIGDNPHRILDIGTGTGIWAIEAADKYPSAQVIGNDISPIQPRWVPPNVSFEVDDVEKDWTYTKNSFDLIYSRYMLGSIKDWPRLICQAFEAVKPGGYLEILEPDSHLRCDDGTMPADSSLLEWTNLFIDAAGKATGSVVDAPNYKGYLQDAGFVDIHEDIFKLPNSPWPKDKHLKEVGGYNMAQFMEGLEGLSLFLFTTVHGMSTDQIQALLAKARADMKNRSMHTYFNLHRYVARKPDLE